MRLRENALILVGVLGLAASASSLHAASARLLTPPPAAWSACGVLAWLGVGASLVWLAPVVDGALARAALRLGWVGALAAAGWAVGVSCRGAYAEVAFATAAEVQTSRVTAVLTPVADANETRRRASLLAVGGRAVEVRLTPSAAAAAARLQCVELEVERTERGDARMAAQGEPLGPASFRACPIAW